MRMDRRVMVVAGLAVLGGCSRIPPKPAGLPADAQWAGEGKDAAFVQIVHLSGTAWHVEVWDRKGTPLAAGTFRLRGFARARIYADEVLGWKNGALQLRDGTWLTPEPAQPARP